MLVAKAELQKCYISNLVLPRLYMDNLNPLVAHEPSAKPTNENTILEFVLFSIIKLINHMLL